MTLWSLSTLETLTDPVSVERLNIPDSKSLVSFSLVESAEVAKGKLPWKGEFGSSSDLFISFDDMLFRGEEFI